MNIEQSRKDEPTSVAKVTERAKPTLVEIGNHQVISSGCWNDELVAEFMLLNGRLRWVEVGELARLAFCRSTPKGKERVRRSLHKLFKTLLNDYGELLAIEYSDVRGRAKQVKIFDPTCDGDCAAIEHRLERMRTRKELSDGQYESAIKALKKKQAA